MTLYSAMYSLLTINFIIALTALYALWRYSQAQGLGLWGLVLAISLAISTAIGFALNRQLRLGAEAGDSSDIVSRDVFLERFNLCLALAERQRSSLSVAKLRLKNIDSLSVEEEAAVLASCAQLLQQSLREEDSLAWRGGDEFLALLPGANSEQARMVVERMLEQLQHQGAGAQPLDCIAGISSYDATQVNPEELIEEAGEALCYARVHGGIALYSELNGSAAADSTLASSQTSA